MHMGKTASQAAKELKCSVATVTRWAKKLHLGCKYGSSYVLFPQEIKQIGRHVQESAGRPKKNSDFSS
jgi:transposase